jgi:chromosome segregation ATPase
MSNPTQEAIAKLQEEISFYQQQIAKLHAELCQPQPQPSPLQGDAQSVVNQVLSRELTTAKVAPSRDARREAIAHFESLINERQQQLVQMLDIEEGERLAAILAEAEARLAAAQARLERLHEEAKAVCDEIGEIGSYHSQYAQAFRERFAKQNRQLLASGKIRELPHFMSGVPLQSTPWLSCHNGSYHFGTKNLNGR